MTRTLALATVAELVRRLINNRGPTMIEGDSREDWKQAAQVEADIRRELKAENDRLRALIEDTVETLEAMDLHTNNPLYDRLRAAVEAA